LRRAGRDDDATLPRRGFIAGAAALVLALRPRPAAAGTPRRIAVELEALFGARPIRPGRVTLDLPAIAENGTTVPMTVAALSPMRADDFCRTIYVFNERNPQPHVGRFHFTPHQPRAQVTTRIRLAAAQTVLAVAEMSDGTLWSGQADVVIGFAACMDPG
jgi:sulfur-oxidizing protein SoxY